MPLYLHTYVWPFVIVWPIVLRYIYTQELYDQYIAGPEWTFVWCGTVVTVQSLVWLCTHWNVNLKSLFTSVSAKTVQDAKLIKVIPIANSGSADICEIVRDTVSIFWRKSGNISLRSTGWRQNEHLFPLPKTPISVRSRCKLIHASFVSTRCRAQASSRGVPVFKRYYPSLRGFQDPATLWRQHLRYPRSLLHGAVQGACRRTLLRLPDILCWTLDAG